MSGIFGILDSRQDTEINLHLARMGRSMSHRPWHVFETHADEQAGIGLGRIGIGILNAERQPAISEDGQRLVFLAGEFYNTAPLRQSLQVQGYVLRDNSDAELLLRLYQAEGAEFIHALQGAFVCAIWDPSCQELVIANDRYGLYPLMYAHYNHKLVFAPEMKAILEQPDFNKELDLTALAEYVRFQLLLGDKSFFAGLKLLPSASILRYNVQTDTCAIRPYWHVAQIPELKPAPTFDEAVEEAGRLLQAALGKLAQGEHRLGVFLSGGLDSRVILGLMDRSRGPVTTITYGRPDCRDMVYARQIARAAGARHYTFEFPDGTWVQDWADFHLELTEGFHSWIHLHGISILGQARSLMDVNLTGLGGEELNWDEPGLYQAQDDLAFTCHLFEQLVRNTTWPGLNDAEERLLYSPRLAAQMRGLAFDSLRSEVARHNSLSNKHRVAWFSQDTVRRLFQYYTVFAKSHIEVRFPFYDYDYLEFVHALPPEMLFARKLRKAVILKRARALARIPYDKDDLPIAQGELARSAHKLQRKCQRFVNRRLPIFPEHPTLNADYENWLRAELRAWGQDLVLGEKTRQHDIFDPALLGSLWQRHQSGLEENFIGKIAPLMTFEMVLRRFFD